MTISWLLHLHQPAIQDEGVVTAISNSSYRPLLAILRDNSGFKVTLSISGTLIEWWQKLGMTDILETLSLLVNRGQVELVGTGFCHPILTLLPKSEIVRQIQLEESLLDTFYSKTDNREQKSEKENGSGKRENANLSSHFSLLSPSSVLAPPTSLRGFFSPEMAISNDLVKTLSEQGYDWVMVDEVAALGRPHFLSVNKLSTKVVVRDRGASLAVAFGFAQTLPTFTNLVENYARFADRLVLAMDGETFGHHWPASLSLLSELAKSTDFNWQTVSDSLVGQKASNVASIQESTWGTSDDDLKNGVIYPKWKLGGSLIHKAQWNLLDLAINLVNVPMYHSDARSARYQFSLRSNCSNGVGENSKNSELPLVQLHNGTIPTEKTVAVADSKGVSKVRELLDRSLGSDQFWWASRNPYWNPGMVERGAEMLLRVVELSEPSSQQAKEARELYNEIIYGLG